VSWRPLLRHASFRRLWLGDAVSMFGDWFTYVAVGTLALADGPLAVALVLLAHTLPRALLAPLAGRLADRVDRRRILVGFSLLRALAVAAMIAAALADQVGAVQALLFVRMALGVFIEPAASAALPQLVPAEEIGRANAALGATYGVIFAAGVAVGGVVTAALGPTASLAIDAATFVIAAGLLATLPPLPPGPASADGGRLADAWAFARADPAVLQAVLAKLPTSLANGGAWVLLHALAGAEAGAAALTLGLFHATRAAGLGLGPLVWARLPRLHGTAAGLHAGAWTCLAGVALFTVVRAPAALLAATWLWGLGLGANWVTASTRAQTRTPVHLLGRVAAIDLLGYTLGACVGGVGAAVLAAWVRADAAGWFGLAAGAAAWAGLEWRVRAAGPKGMSRETGAAGGERPRRTVSAADGRAVPEDR
jgi:MFS family permease